MVVLATLMRLENKTSIIEKNKKVNWFKDIKDGLRYIIDEKELLKIILVITVAGIFIYNYDVLIPVFTNNILHENEKIYGLLISSLGIGSLMGALMVSLKSKTNAKMKVLIGSAIIEGALLIFISVTRTYYITMIFMVLQECLIYGSVLQLIPYYSLLQETNTGEEL